MSGFCSDALVQWLLIQCFCAPDVCMCLCVCVGGGVCTWMLSRDCYCIVSLLRGDVGFSVIVAVASHKVYLLFLNGMVKCIVTP